MSYTYPPAAPTVSGDDITINRFLNNPTLVARRMQTLLQQRYIADALLTGRFTVEGGAISVESGEPLFADDDPRAVPPGGEYHLTTLGGGELSVLKTVKWGEDTEVTDESIKRRKMDPVNRALTRLANQNVKYVDSVAMAAISSAITSTQAALADWSTATAEQILTDALLAKANVVALDLGFEPDTIVIDDINHAYAMARFAAAGYFPRESGDTPILTGEFPVVGGLRWLPTTHTTGANTALVADSTQLGGMADEDLGGPGYVSASGPGTASVQVKSMREDKEDKYRLRARRVTVPVVVEPLAARTITGI
jgi:hypothetical protein